MLSWWSEKVQELEKIGKAVSFPTNGNSVAAGKMERRDFTPFTVTAVNPKGKKHYWRFPAGGARPHAVPNVTRLIKYIYIFK